jgi:ABC-type branched-subunit amino acid transport system substrate-binding protein
MRRLVVVLALPAMLAACAPREDPIVIGAVYPTAGGQGPGGLEEYRGVLLAADLATRRGGVDGRLLQVRLAPADSAEAAPGAVAGLVDDGADLLVGSYGSTISRPAAAEAASRGAFFWETGAVGEMDRGSGAGELVFRFAPTGGSLGRAAVDFVHEQLLPQLADEARPRYAVTYVDDEYGRAVGGGALSRIRGLGLPMAGVFPYDPRAADQARLARSIERAGTDVLVVVAYLEDGVAMRRALVREEVPLLASIGTSSSYCHPEFGAILGPDAVGLFASDKPDAASVNVGRLTPAAADVLRWGRARYRSRYGAPMSSAALSGFAAGWALFHHVLPAAEGLSPSEVAAAARSMRLPMGSLPNAGGLELAPAGHPDAGANLRASHVIWEWVADGRREIVWPPALATDELVPIALR